MDKIDILKQLLLTHRTENISKLTFEERLKFDDSFAEEIVKLFAIPDVSNNEVACCGNCHLPLDKIEVVPKVQIADKKYNP